jgi:hypothetical protein
MPVVNPVGRKRGPKSETLRRVGRVESWGGYVHVRADRDRSGAERHSLHALMLKGNLNEPVSGMSAFEMSVYSDPRAGVSVGDVPAIGTWVKVKPVLDGLVVLTEREFDLVLALAAGGKLVSVAVSFQKPHYGRGAITSVDFSSEMLDE